MPNSKHKSNKITDVNSVSNKNNDQNQVSSRPKKPILTAANLKIILCCCPRLCCLCYKCCLRICCLQSLCKPPHAKLKKLGICPPYDFLQLLSYLWFILHPLSVILTLYIFSPERLFIAGFLV